MRISQKLEAEIRRHAEAQFPSESCGLLVRTVTGRAYVPCRNAATTAAEHFVIAQESWSAAEDQGQVLAVVHSHPNGSPRPSQVDRVSCELHELPWAIVAWPGGTIEWLQPSGYTAPLLGRDFSHGVLDCYTLVRDWYAREWNLYLPDYPRHDLWWEDKNGPSLYEQHFADAGFVQVGTPQRGDVLVMMVGRTYHPNHAAIYLGDDGSLVSEPAVALGGQGPFFIHHLYGRSSTRNIYGPDWAMRTRLILRHQQARS